MGTLITATTIANRAFQLIGARRVTNVLTDPGNPAGEFNTAYDLLRRYELRRNVWRFAVRRAALAPVNIGFQPGTQINNQTFYPTMQLSPAAWSNSATYSIGSITKDTDGFIYKSLTLNNVGNQPSANVGTYWEPYYGPMDVQPYDTTGGTAYLPGQLVYDPFTYPTVVYMSLIYQSTSSSNPQPSPTAGTPSWSASLTYNQGDAVTYSATTYISQVPLNNNVTPGTNNAIWKAAGAVADLQNNGAWLTLSECSAVPINILYPLGAGPSYQLETRNIYMLPNGYLRNAPEDPKAGNVNFLGASGGLRFDDWTYESNYFITREAGVLMLRFSADIQDTSKFDPMFAEALAAKIGMEICEKVTQSVEKVSRAMAAYKTALFEATTVNGIEQGPVESPEDEYIEVRL